MRKLGRLGYRTPKGFNLINPGCNPGTRTVGEPLRLGALAVKKNTLNRQGTRARGYAMA